MKKIMIAALLVIALAPVAEAKTVKEAASQTGSNISGFFKRESERSGVKMPSPPEVGNFFQRLNPIPFLKRKQDEYNARKAAK